jgi:hypothetical protein
MDGEEARKILQKSLEAMKTTLNEQALQNLRELLDAGFDSFQEYGEFKKTKLKSND